MAQRSNNVAVKDVLVEECAKGMGKIAMRNPFPCGKDETKKEYINLAVKNKHVLWDCTSSVWHRGIWGVCSL